VTEIRIDFDFGHPPALVWRALTDRRQLARWFMPSDLQAIQGSKFQLLPDALPGFDGPIAGQVLEVSAERRLVMRWKGEQLHARVAWEIKGKPEGCLLMVSQSGFLGVQGSARRQALVSTYDRLFGERLPAVLDGLAGKGDAVVPRPPRLPEPVRPRGSAGRAPFARWAPRGRQVLAIAAAALLIGLVAALLSSLPSKTSAPAEAVATGSGGQPAGFASATVAPATASGVTQRPPAASPPASARTSAPPATRPPSASPRTERATTPAPRPAALAARYRTVSTNAVGYRGEVVVENKGGTASGGWTLTITVPALALVTKVEGPQPSLGGAGWTFAGAAVPEGGSARVVFDVVLDLDLLGPKRPLSCNLGGAACAGL
jgi:uncharacterized protein YndB with AHSA1/START domain